jgi:NAD(P)-dependent dehydrogenase (short-subunit alcohol dehydrogenase family)
MAMHLGPRGVRVNALAPGSFRTDMTAGVTEQAGSNLIAHIPLGRIGKDADIVGAAVFLASDACAFVNGIVLAVDGGQLRGVVE